MDSTKVKATVRGKVVSIDRDKRTMLVRDNTNPQFPQDYALKWLAVMDDVCNKEKIGNRVLIETITDMTLPDPQPYITSVKFDESYKKDKSTAYADPNSDLILLQSCLRTGATVLGYTVLPGEENGFAETMDLLIARAVKDAKTLKQEAKKL